MSSAYFKPVSLMSQTSLSFMCLQELSWRILWRTATTSASRPIDKLQLSASALTSSFEAADVRAPGGPTNLNQDWWQHPLRCEAASAVPLVIVLSIINGHLQND